ncbi:MAG TPA: amidohydrolase family protein [Puia sp.]|nr:amidohydrolase family protein [Puia sp.]
MKHPFLLLISALILSNVRAQTYLIHANLVDPVTQRTLPDQTIVYKGNTILQVGPSSTIKPSKGAKVVDATGKWVMPGMVDAHVHFFQTGGLYTRPDAIDLRKYKPYEQEIAWYKEHMEQQLRRYTAAGITTVIDDGTTLALLQQRDTFATKDYAPRIYMAGPLISTGYDPRPFDGLIDPDKPIYAVNSPDQAVQRVTSEYSHHPDLIKIWYIVLDADTKTGAEKNLPSVKATVAEAHAHGYRIAVHATERVTAQLAVEAGADFLVHDVEDELVDDAFVKLLKDHHVVLCPTLVVMDGYFDTFGSHYIPTPEDIAFGDPEQLRSLQDLAHLPDTALVRRYHTLARMRAKANAHLDSTRLVNLKKLADGGVIIATGTDAGNIGTLHASSFFKEIRAMQQAGLSNWQILTASTWGGAKALGKDTVFGNIRPGLSADMLILNADPVADLANLQKLETIIQRGVWFYPDKARPVQ